MPRHDSDQELLNTARAFATDAAPFQAQFVSLNLAATFIADLNTDIDDFETAIKGKGTGKGKKAGATTGIGKTIHDAGIALHVLNTIVPNTYKNDPQKLAEWVVASHVEKHTPVPRTCARCGTDEAMNHFAAHCKMERTSLDENWRQTGKWFSSA